MPYTSITPHAYPLLRYRVKPACHSSGTARLATGESGAKVNLDSTDDYDDNRYKHRPFSRFA